MRMSFFIMNGSKPSQAKISLNDGRNMLESRGKRKNMFFKEKVYQKHSQKGFTLMETLIVIAVLAVLAAVVGLAVNPGQQMARGRDRTRESHVSSLYNALLSYQADDWGAFSAGIDDAKGEEICNTNKIDSEDCGTMIDLSFLVPDYISSLPVDPQGGLDNDGTGYRVVYTDGNIGTQAPKAETKDIIRAGAWRMTDPRDGEAYATVLIGDQLWMAENLDYDDGCTGVAWVDESDEGWCGYYNNNQGTYGHYGLLYQWSAANNVCPDGWKLPSDPDYQELEEYLGMTNASSSGWRYTGNVGAKLKADSELWTIACPAATHWCDGAGGSHNVPVPGDCYVSGFNAWPGGRRLEGGGFASWAHAFFWSSSSSGDNAWHRFLRRDYSGVNRFLLTQARACSVRCLRD